MVNKIYHIADLHIRADRRQEYLPVFNNLISYLASTATSNDVVIICGDVFHFMSRYQGPEDIIDFCGLIDGISAICPVIIIAGNHDTIMNNKTKTDLITPIYDMIKQYRSNVYYYNKTGVYKYDNLHLAVLSVIDNAEPTVLVDAFNTITVNNGEYKVALVHEDINGATFGDFTIKDARLDDAFLRNFDYVLAGHLHNYQVIDVPNADRKVNVAYPGALFQQNIGESLDKGLIKWNLADGTHDFVKIQSNTAFIKFVIEDDKIQDAPYIADSVKVKDIMIEYKNSSSEFVKGVVEELSAKYNFPIKRIIDKNPAKKASSSVYGSSESLRDYKSQDELITKFLQDKKVIDDQITKILDQHKEYSKTSDQSARVNTRWRLISMEWSNMFCYGENNCIDFTKIHANSLIGIIANNRAGKSSVIDILIYTLFNKMHRGDVKHIARIGSKNYYVKLVLEIDGLQCSITRQCHGSSNPTVVFVYNGENKTRESIPTTYHDISKYVGTYDDFVRTNIMCQDNIEDFVKLSSVNKRKFLIKFFQLDTWIDIEAQVRKDIVKLNSDITKELPQGCTLEAYDANHINNIKNDKEKIDANIAAIDAKEKDSQQQEATLVEQKEQLLKEYDNSVSLTQNEYNNALTMQKELTKKIPMQSLDELTEMLHKKISERRTVNAKFTTAANFDSKQDSNTIKVELSAIKTKLGEYANLQIDSIPDINMQLANLSHEKAELQKKLTKLAQYKSNKGIQSAVNIFIKTNKLALDDLTFAAASCTCCAKNKELHSQHKELLADINADIEEYNRNNKVSEDAYKVDSSMQDAKGMQSRIDGIALEEGGLRDVLANIAKKQKLAEQYDKLTDILNNYDDISHNAKIDTQIEYLKRVINNVTIFNDNARKIKIYEKNRDIAVQLRAVNAKLSDITAELKKSRNTIVSLAEQRKENELLQTQAEQLLVKLKAMASKRDILKLYLTCLDSKTGIPFKILSNVFITLEKEVNNLLNRITDFSISLINNEGDGKKEPELKVTIVSPIKSSDGKHSINLPLELGSGFQQFIISIVMRIVLAQMFPSQLSDFFIIDEGFSCMDQVNISGVQQFLTYIKRYFRFILIISHLDVLQNMVEYPITITNNDNMSFISNVDDAERAAIMANQSYGIHPAVQHVHRAHDSNTTAVHDNSALNTDNANNLTNSTDATAQLVDTVLKNGKEYISCKYCNVEIQKGYFARHEKSVKHMQMVAKNK